MPILGGDNMLDVVVSVYKDGVLVNKNGKSSAGKSVAICGKVICGKAVCGRSKHELHETGVD